MKKKFIGMKLTLTLLGVLGSQAIVVPAQQRQVPLPIDDLLSTLHFTASTPLDLSPDGKLVACTLQDDRRKEKPTEGYASVYFTHTGVSQYALGSDIWIADTQTKESKNLTEGKGTNWGPSRNPAIGLLRKYSAFNSILLGHSSLPYVRQ